MRAGNQRLTGMHGQRFFFLSKEHLYRQQAFLTPSEDGKCSMRRHRFNRFIVVEIVAVLGRRRIGFLFRHHLAHQIRLLPEEFAQFFKHVSIFKENFCEDVASTIKRCAHVGHALVRVNKGRGLRFRVAHGIFPQHHGQRLQPCLSGYLRTSTALGLIRQIQVFQTLLGIGRPNVAFKLFGELARVAQGLQDRSAALLELTLIDQLLLQIAQLRVIESAGDFLAVAGDKGNRSAFIEQVYGGSDLVDASADSFGNARLDGGAHVSRKFGHGTNKRKAPQQACRMGGLPAERRSQSMFVGIKLIQKDALEDGFVFLLPRLLDERAQRSRNRRFTMGKIGKRHRRQLLRRAGNFHAQARRRIVLCLLHVKFHQSCRFIEVHRLLDAVRTEVKRSIKDRTGPITRAERDSTAFDLIVEFFGFVHKSHQPFPKHILIHDFRRFLRKNLDVRIELFHRVAALRHRSSLRIVDQRVFAPAPMRFSSHWL